MKLKSVSRPLLVGIMALALVMAAVALSHDGGLTQANGITRTVLTTANLGSPAIRPHINLNRSDPRAPTYTEADVRAYILRFGQDGFAGNPVAPGHTLRFVYIKFVTSAQASKMMAGESTGLPDDAVVCIVKVAGPFLLTQMHGPAGGSCTEMAPTGHMVFNGKTGNLLLWGVEQD